MEGNKRKQLICLIATLLALCLLTFGLKSCDSSVRLPALGTGVHGILGGGVDGNVDADAKKVDDLINGIKTPITLESAGAIGAAINGTLEGIDKHDGYLLNSTEEGIAIIPMDYKGVMMTINPSKMVPVLEKAVFVSNEGIESIVAKNYNIFNSKVKTVNMVFKDETKLCLIVKAVEKDIPYHQDNFNKFFEKYKKK